MKEKISTEIHPTALVSPKAELGTSVRIGPYTTIGENVTIENGTVVGSHVVIEGHTKIGERNNISPFVTIGAAPQDISYGGEDTRVIIGDDNVIREYVSINRASTKQEWETIVGNHNFLMAYVHIAHDCVLGNDNVMSNLATLAGHIKVGDHVIFGGLAVVHQFVQIGSYAFLGAKSGINQDVPPFMMTSGHNAKLYGVNQVGLSRKGFSRETIDGLKKAFRIIWRKNRRLSEGIKQVRKEIEPFPELEMLLDFFSKSTRGITR
jgi:UDP-N-acetylglucosamine acyltransferase